MAVSSPAAHLPRSFASLLVLAAVLACGVGCGDGSGGGGAEASVVYPSGPDPEAIVFHADFGDGDLDQWTEVQEVGEGASVEVLGPADGPPPGVENFARFRLGAGDERAEVYRDLELGEGDDVYFRFLLRLGEDFPAEDTWQLIWQLHQADDDGSPPLALMVDGSSPGRLALRGDDPEDVYWEGPEVDPGRWHEFVIRVNHSNDGDSGFVELWLDRVSQGLAGGEPRLYVETLEDEYNYPKAGYYRDPEMEGEGVVDIADYLIWR